MLSAQHASHPSHPPPPSSSTGEDVASKVDDTDVLVDISMLREIAKRALVDALNSVNGAKTVVLDPSLAGPLGLVTEVALLKQHGVDKMFWLEKGPLNATTTNIVYLCRPQIRLMKIVAGTFNPTPRLPSAKVLEEEGVFGELTISSYKLEFIPLEDDLVSLEWETTFKEIFLDGDESAVYYAAQALITMQQAYGLFPRIIGKGDAAKKLASLLLHLRAYPTYPSQINDPNLSTPSNLFDSLVIVDRSSDMITPLMTQLTYEGLMDEYYGIKNSHVELDASMINPPSTAGASQPAGGSSSGAGLAVTPATAPKKKKQHLTSATDGLYSQLRDTNFAVIGPKLSREAKRLDQEYKGRHQAQTVAQLRDFVGRLGGLQNEHQNLRMHTEISEQLSTFTRTDLFNKGLEIQQNLLASYEPNSQISAIEDLISQQAPLQLVLRLLCIASLTSGGIKAKSLENIKREILQTYGYELLPLLLSLNSLSLLLPNPLPKPAPTPTPSNQTGSTSLKPPPIPPVFTSVRKSFRLLSDAPEATPTDVSYVYSGHAPLSVRLVQAVAMKGVVLTNLPLVGGASSNAPESSAQTNLPAGQREPRVEKVASHPITGWKGFEDTLRLLPGALVDEIQKGDGDSKPSTSTPLNRGDRPTTTMVFFLGGCTYTEISAIRWMGQHMRGRQFLIGTTGIINGCSLLDSIAPSGVKLQPFSATM